MEVDPAWPEYDEDRHSPKVPESDDDTGLFNRLFDEWMSAPMTEPLDTWLNRRGYSRKTAASDNIDAESDIVIPF